MKVTRDKNEGCQAFLVVEMESTEMETSLATAYRHLAVEVKIPGFRQGKAPRAVLERYLDKGSVLSEALNHMVPEAYQQAIKEQEIEPFAQPNIEITQTEPVVIFKATVPLTPKVELGDYHKVKIKPEPATVAEDKVDAVIEQLRHQQGAWEPVARPVNFGDLAVLDIESDVAGEPFVNSKGVQYFVLREATAPVKGFAEHIVGMEKDEEKAFCLSVPEDFPKSELAGKEASFKVKVGEIKEEELPEVNDEFARQVNPELETVAALKEQISDGLKQRAEEDARLDFEERLVAAVVDCSEVEFPPVLVEAEIDRLFDEQARRLQMDEKALEKYLKTVNKTEEQLREELRPVATKRVTGSLVLEKVAEKEGIEVSEADIDAEIDTMVKNTETKNKDELSHFLNYARSRESLKSLLLTRKTLAQVKEIAGGAGKTKSDGKEKKQ